MKRFLLGVILLGLGWGGNEVAGQVVLPFQVKSLGKGLYEVGGVTFDADKKSLWFEVTVNQSTGPLEYVLVHESGKVHESLFRTSVSPFSIHLAALLLGVEVAGGERNRGDALMGREVKLVLRGVVEEEVAGWIEMTRGDGMGLQGPWIYTGSRMMEGGLVAQRDGSIVALMEDGDSLIGFGGEDRLQDDLWVPNEKVVPEVGEKRVMEIRLSEEKKKEANPAHE